MTIRCLKIRVNVGIQTIVYIFKVRYSILQSFFLAEQNANYLKLFGAIEWKGINHKQSTRWQHLSQLKASAFFSLQKIFSCYETQQLILGTGTAIWWVTEPHLKKCIQMLEKSYPLT